MSKMRRLQGFLAIGLVTLSLSAARLEAQDCRQPDEERCKAEERRKAQERRKADELRDYIKANYTKYEYLAPMRDGVKLFVAVYAPKDSSQRYPIMMLRTPYTVAPYGIDNYRRTLGPSEFFVHEGYIFADCDVRGRGKSEGTFVHVRPYIPNKTGRTRSTKPATPTIRSSSF